MARMIDLSTLGIGERNPNAFNDPERAYGWNDLLKILEAAPTVDSVEVVRCRDCKFYELKYYPDGKQRMCCENNNAIWTTTKPDDFCSYGERKDGGGNGLFQP